MKYNTLAIHGGKQDQTEIKGVNYPIYLSSTFIQPEFGTFQKYAYSRGNNPTREAVEELVADLEEARYSLALASGMAATSLVFSLVQTGEKVLLSNNVYGGTFRYVSNVFESRGIEYEIIDDFNELDYSKLEGNVTTIFLETPSNPLLEITDIKKVTDNAHKKNIRVIVDNTFLTSYYQKPLKLGADIVVYSATKYYAGHSDILAGLVVLNDDAVYQKLKFLQNTLGAILSPFDSFLLSRGIKTLGLRLERHNFNAQEVAKYLSAHVAVEDIYYPGLETNKGYEIQKRQASGNGAVLSIRLKKEYSTKEFADALQIFGIAVSIGGVESLICHPMTMTHESYPREIQRKLGIDERLVRLAIGIEDLEDLINDLKQALEKSTL